MKNQAKNNKTFPSRQNEKNAKTQRKKYKKKEKKRGTEQNDGIKTWSQMEAKKEIKIKGRVDRYEPRVNARNSVSQLKIISNNKSER